MLLIKGEVKADIPMVETQLPPPLRDQKQAEQKRVEREADELLRNAGRGELVESLR